MRATVSADTDAGQDLVVFWLDEQRYALHLAVVDRVVRAVAVAPLPGAPEIVSGIINVQGRIVPVLKIRKRFQLPERELQLWNQLVIARTRHRTVALVVDAVSGIVPCSEPGLVASETILPGLEHVQGVLKLPDGMVLVHDLDRFLSLAENETLTKALESAPVML